MRRRHVTLLLAVAMIVLVGGTAFLSQSQAQRSDAIRATKPDSPYVGAAGVASVKAESAATKVVIARPHVTRPLRSITPLRADTMRGQAEENEGAYVLKPSKAIPDGALQSEPGHGMPTPTKNFDGLSNVDGALRPDTSGDVGSNHYMQWINLSFAVFDKAGNLVYGPAAGNTLFQGHSVCGTRNGGDPVILYDQFAKRWFATQSAYDSLVNGPYYQCVAVSKSSDPTGAWCSYQFLTHTTKFTDYSKFGVWPSQNAYFMTSPQYLRGASFAGIGIWAFERDQLLNCGSARFVYQDMNSIEPTLPRMLPADADGMRAPPAGSAAPFMTMNWNGSGLEPNTLQLWNTSINWSSLSPRLTITHTSDIPTAAYDSNLCNYNRACIEQPGTTAKVDALADRLMYRLAYRNFGNKQVMVVNQTVDVGNDHAGIRWYELTRPDGGSWGIAQQGTYAPDSVNRFMGSAAMDSSGNIAVGYSVSDGQNVAPGVRYAGRLATDPAGVLAQGEVTLVNGTGVQTQQSSHWGDYSMMSLDPADDCTFWYAQEYYGETGNAAWKTRIGSFRFPTCGASPSN